MKYRLNELNQGGNDMATASEKFKDLLEHASVFIILFIGYHMYKDTPIGRLLSKLFMWKEEL